MSATKRPRKRCAPKGRHRFTREECRRGYQAAQAKCMQSWELAAWFFRRVRRYYGRQDGDPA